ncbi:uncharacterized protein [Anabrus simplex]|uniref:uncharacterized protein isoform X2 n=1 Tax=Anabrus simplex TaxID=316456 RepID=UPI0035A263AB
MEPNGSQEMDTIAPTQMCATDDAYVKDEAVEMAENVVVVKEEFPQEQENGEFETTTTGPEGGELEAATTAAEGGEAGTRGREGGQAGGILDNLVREDKETGGEAPDSVEGDRPPKTEVLDSAENGQNKEDHSDEPLLVRRPRRKQFSFIPYQIYQTIKSRKKKPSQRRRKPRPRRTTFHPILPYPETPLQFHPGIPMGQTQLLLPSGVQIKQEPGEETQPEPLPVVQPFSLFYHEETAPQRQIESRKNVEEEEEEEENYPIEDDPSLHVSSTDKKPRDYTIKEYCDMYLIYGECHGGGQAAARLYAKRYPKRRHPIPSIFHSLDIRLREYGQVVPMYANITGRCPKELDVDEDDDECEIWDLINEDPRRSARLRHPSSKYEDLHPYHYIKKQKLNSKDRKKRIKFCRWLLKQHQGNTRFLDSVLWNSEALFSRKGIFNYESAQYWTVENPNSIFQQGIKERKGSNLWVGIIHEYILGPYALPDKLTPEYYNYFITEVLPRLMEDIPLNIRSRVCYQMDRNPTHCLKAVRKVLPTIFPGGWLGKGNSMPWPPHSQDLNPVEFFMWNYLKTIVYDKLYDTVEDLIASVRSGIASVTVDMLQQVRESIIRRAEACIMADGGHFESLL